MKKELYTHKCTECFKVFRTDNPEQKSVPIVCNIENLVRNIVKKKKQCLFWSVQLLLKNIIANIRQVTLTVNL